MDCPQCGVIMRERDRSGIRVDFCPACKGVWLDRGELDKIIEREVRYDDDDDDDGERRDRFEFRRDRDDRDSRDDRPAFGSRGSAPRRKKSFFEALTDLAGGNDD